MRVLVTGGGGFIGSHVVDRLIERGDTPRIFDLSASPYHSPLEVETFTGSITDPANLDLAGRHVVVSAGGTREHLDPVHPRRLHLPEGMTSGLYKYIVFDPIERSTGKVYDQPCHRIMGTGDDLPNTDWVAENHWCVPLYYQPEVSA